MRVGRRDISKIAYIFSNIRNSFSGFVWNAYTFSRKQRFFLFVSKLYTANWPSMDDSLYFRPVTKFQIVFTQIFHQLVIPCNTTPDSHIPTFYFFCLSLVSCVTIHNLCRVTAHLIRLEKNIFIFGRLSNFYIGKVS